MSKHLPTRTLTTCRRSLACLALFAVAAACDTRDVEQQQPEAASSVATRSPAIVTPVGSHRPGAPIELAEAVGLLPTIDDATSVTAPRQLPHERVLAEYCHDTGALAERAEALAEALRSDWADVSVQDASGRRIIRAGRGDYVLRATLAPGAQQGCSGPDAVLVRLIVFKPQGPGGRGPARRG
jgi:hypothetical protein